MICNIVDSRKNNKKWKSVWGVLEPIENDNSCKGADQASYSDRFVFVEYSPELQFNKLIEWAQSYDGNNTLYVYDIDPSFCAKM